jgi:predicted permease
MATIVFAVGVKAAMVCVTRSIVEVSPGIPEFDRLVHYTIGNGADRIPFSGPAYEVLHAHSRFADLAIWNSSVSLVLQTPDGATRMPGALVNGSFFRVMKLRPALGRFFEESDDQPGGGDSGWVAVLGYTYWKSRFRADPQAVGSLMAVDGAPVRIVGVLPEGFRGLEPPAMVQILLPRHFLSVASPGQDRFAVAGDMEWDLFGRLQKGETAAEVESILHTVEPRFRVAADPDGALLTETNFPGIRGRHLLFAHAGELSPACGLKAIQTPLLLMNGLAGIIVILSACNLIFLFAGHRTRQGHEAAIRIALGATRKHVLPGVLSEAIALAGIGSLIAIPLAKALARVISLLVQSAAGLESFPIVTPDTPLLLTAATWAVGATSIIALVTALWHDRRHITSPVGGLAVTRRSNAWIAGFEVFVSMILSTVAISGVIGFEKLVHEPSGFGENRAVTASLGFSGTIRSDEAMPRIVDRIVHAPGVRAVATMNVAPLSGGSARGEFSARLNDGSLSTLKALWPELVSVHYFRAAGTRIIRGRDFAPADLAGTPTCLLSLGAAKALFGPEDPLDKFVYSGESDTGGQSKAYCRTIGIVENAHLKSMSQSPEEVIYGLTNETMTNLVVGAVTPNLAIGAIRNSVHAIAPMSLTSHIEPLHVRIEEDLRLTRLLTLCAALSAGITGLIMAIGVFGVLALEVGARRRDIGIQISLGASKLAIGKALMKRFSRAIGVSLSVGTVWTLTALVWLSERNWVTLTVGAASYFAALVLLALVLLAAATAPLRRAMANSPIECMRSE